MILPRPIDDSELVDASTFPDLSLVDPICPWVYHRVISEVAIVHYRFQRARREGSIALEALVATANEELARIISNLPPHMQPDMQNFQELDLLRTRAPWIEWQRIDLFNLLLSYRILINRVIEETPSIAEELPNSFVGARSVCVDAARTIISINIGANLPTNQSRYW